MVAGSVLRFAFSAKLLHFRELFRAQLGVGGKRSIDLLQESGREEVLRIVGEGGEQTLLRLVSPVADSATR